MKKSTVIIMWGVITVVLMKLLSFVLYKTGNILSPLNYLGFVVLFIGLLIGIIQFRNKVNGGYGTFGQLYGVGILMILIMAIIATIYTTGIVTIVPDYMQQYHDAKQAFIINMHMPSEMTQRALAKNNESTSPLVMIVGAFFGVLIIGALLNLLAAGISTKPKPFMEEDNNAMPL